MFGHPAASPKLLLKDQETLTGKINYKMGEELPDFPSSAHSIHHPNRAHKVMLFDSSSFLKLPYPNPVVFFLLLVLLIQPFLREMLLEKRRGGKLKTGGRYSRMVSEWEREKASGKGERLGGLSGEQKEEIFWRGEYRGK